MLEKFTVEKKAETVIESFTTTNIAQQCRKHGVSVAQFYGWKEKFLKSGKRGLGKGPKGNEYKKKIDAFICHYGNILLS